MKIKLWIEDTTPDGHILEELVTCLTDNPRRAVEMYSDRELYWADKGYSPTINWAEVEPDKSVAAAALGSIKSKRKAKSSRENGKLGGRPRKATR